MKSILNELTLGVLFACTAASLGGCGKEVEIEGSGSGLTSATPGTPLPSASCEIPKHWRFTQPDTVENRAVDLLFVVDTSSSLREERARLAATVPAFLEALDARTDYRIGVMLGHGGASAYSGRLYAPAGTPKVLSAAAMSPDAIRAALATTLAQEVADADEANGEMLLYSFNRALQSDRYAEARALGFFRPDAALSVVFISDENDVCFQPQLNGFTAFPDYVPSTRGFETTAFNRYCVDRAGTPLITADRVLSAARARKGENPLSFGAIAHVDPGRVPNAAGSEDAIGHGFLELVRGTPAGLMLELADVAYTAGLARLGTIVRTSLNLKSVFALDNTSGVRPESVRVLVDRALVAARYDKATGTVELAPEQAGHAGSTIEVSGCMD